MKLLPLAQSEFVKFKAVADYQSSDVHISVEWLVVVRLQGRVVFPFLVLFRFFALMLVN